MLTALAQSHLLISRSGNRVTVTAQAIQDALALAVPGPLPNEFGDAHRLIVTDSNVDDVAMRFLQACVRSTSLALDGLWRLRHLCIDGAVAVACVQGCSALEQVVCTLSVFSL